MGIYRSVIANVAIWSRNEIEWTIMCEMRANMLRLHILVQACLRAPHVVADDAKLAIVFTYFTTFPKLYLILVDFSIFRDTLLPRV